VSYLTPEYFRTFIEAMQRTPHLVIDTEGTINPPFAETWGLSASVNGASEYLAFNHKLGENLPREWLKLVGDTVLNRDAQR
jgi:hypothetical protein